MGMQVSIAAVEKIEGIVSAVDQQSSERELSLGDSLFLDEVINATEKSHVLLQMSTGDKILIEALQSVKLNSDVVPDLAYQQSDSTLSSNLSLFLKQQLLSSLLTPDISILSSIESIYDMSRCDNLQNEDLHIDKAVSLALQDIFQNSGKQTLDSFLRFDEIGQSTVIYISTQGKLTALVDAKNQADEVFIINSIGYKDNDDLLSYLLASYPVD